RAQARNFFQRGRDKGLPAEAGIDRHHQNEIDEIDQRLDRALARARIKRHPCLPAERADCLQRAMHMRPRLDVNGNDVGAGFGKSLEIGIAGRDHQVHVEHFLGVRTQRFHHAGTDRDIGHEVPVHYVDMDPIGAGVIDRAHLLAELGEVGGQNRRGDDERAWHFLLSDRRSPNTAGGEGQRTGFWAVDSNDMTSAQAANSVRSLPPLAGEGWGGGEDVRSLSFCTPPPYPSPASGGGDDVARSSCEQRPAGCCRARPCVRPGTNREFRAARLPRGRRKCFGVETAWRVSMSWSSAPALSAPRSRCSSPSAASAWRSSIDVPWAKRPPMAMPASSKA